MTKLSIGIPVYDVIYKGYLYYYISVKAHLPDSTMSHYDYVYLLSKALSCMTMLILDSHIHFQFILFPPILFFIFLFLPIKTQIFLNIEGHSGEVGLHARTRSTTNDKESTTLRSSGWFKGRTLGHKEQNEK